MAEKKYLFVFEVDNKEDLKDNLPDCNGCTCWPCDEHCIGRKKVISRQEAIERMAKAMCHSPYESCESCMGQKKKQVCKQALKGMKELAEAALNAIAPMIPQEEEK